MRRSLVVAVLIALAATTDAAPVPKAPVNQWLMAMDGHVYLFAEGDKEPKKLTDGEGGNAHPAWSADGKRIAFVSKRNGKNQIHTMDIDGKNVTQITKGDHDSYSPGWSLDGKGVAFDRRIIDRFGGESYEICVVNASDGSDFRVLTSIDDEYPSFSPDGKYIAFLSTRDQDGYRLYKMDAAGQNATQLTDKSLFGASGRPAWSPDGKKIAYSNLMDGHGIEIHVVQADGTGQKAITKLDRNASFPSWSPDGMQMAFVLSDQYETKENQFSLWVMDADGGNQKEILRMGKRRTSSVAWRPK